MHENFVSLASRMLTAHGRAMQLVPLVSSGDDWDDDVTEGTPQDIIGVQTTFKLNEVDGDRVQSRDKRVLIDSTVTPSTNMILRDNGVDYSVIDVDTIQPGPTSIMYKLQVRG